MDSKEALERLKLISDIVDENRADALDNGKSWMWLCGLGSLVLFIAYGARQLLLLDAVRWLLPASALLIALASAYIEWRRYRRYQNRPTLAFKVYMAFTLGLFYLGVPLGFLYARGLVDAQILVPLIYAIMALSFAVFRAVLGYGWLHGFSLLWFGAACLMVFMPSPDPLLASAVMMLLGGALPGYCMYRASPKSIGPA